MQQAYFNAITSASTGDILLQIFAKNPKLAYQTFLALSMQQLNDVINKLQKYRQTVGPSQKKIIGIIDFNLQTIAKLKISKAQKLESTKNNDINERKIDKEQTVVAKRETPKTVMKVEKPQPNIRVEKVLELNIESLKMQAYFNAITSASTGDVLLKVFEKNPTQAFQTFLALSMQQLNDVINKLQKYRQTVGPSQKKIIRIIDFNLQALAKIKISKAQKLESTKNNDINERKIDKEQTVVAKRETPKTVMKVEKPQPNIRVEKVENIQCTMDLSYEAQIQEQDYPLLKRY